MPCAQRRGVADDRVARGGRFASASSAPAGSPPTTSSCSASSATTSSQRATSTSSARRSSRRTGARASSAGRSYSSGKSSTPSGWRRRRCSTGRRRSRRWSAGCRSSSRSRSPVRSTTPGRSRRRGATGVVCAIGYQWHATEALEWLLEALGAQQVAYLWGVSAGPTAARPWFLDRAGGGGNLLERGSHQLDLQRAVAGEVASVQVAASAVHLAQSEVRAG